MIAELIAELIADLLSLLCLLLSQSILCLPAAMTFEDEIGGIFVGIILLMGFFHILSNEASVIPRGTRANVEYIPPRPLGDVVYCRECKQRITRRYHRIHQSTEKHLRNVSL